MEHLLKFLNINETAANQKDDVVQIGVEPSVQFAESNAVGVGNEYFQIAELTDTNRSFLSTFGKGTKRSKGTGSR